MTETGGHDAPSPLIESNWLAERLHNPDFRILDCAVIMQVTDDCSSGKAEWDAAHIPGSVFVDILTDLRPRYAPAVPLMAPLADFVAAKEFCGIETLTHQSKME